MILAVDIGGTSIKGAILEHGVIVAKSWTHTDISNTPDSIFQSLFKVIDELLSSGHYVDKIGISSAGDVDPVTGKVLYATQSLPNYTGQDLRGKVNARYGIHVSVLNDAMCALIGELESGAGKGIMNVMMLTLGTGVGGEISNKGKVLLGSEGRGSRLGHEFYKTGRKCACGKDGCLECYVSATGLLRTANEMGLKIDDCRQLETHENTKLINKVLEKFSFELAEVVQILVAKNHVQMVIIGGGIVTMKDLWWDMFCKFNSDKVIVKIAELGNTAGIIGAEAITREIMY